MVPLMLGVLYAYLIPQHEPHPFVTVQEHQHRTSTHLRAKNITGPGFISLREPP